MQWDIYKDVNKGNEWYTKMKTKAMRYIQRGKQMRWDDIQRCKQRKWDIYKDVKKGNQIYTKM